MPVNNPFALTAGVQYANGAVVATPTGTQVIGWDGTDVWAISAAHLTNANALAVEIVDAAGHQITSFGGGTQYADDAASGAHPTGTLSMGWDSANSVVRALKVDTSQNLLVSVANTSIAVTQGTSPWVISFTAPQHVIVDSGSIAVSGSVSITGTVGVTQSTNPWVVSGAKTPADSYANPTDAEDAFALLGGWDATNTKWQRVQVDAGTGIVKVDIGSNGTVAVSGNVNVTQGTSPWVISFTAPQHVIVDSGTVTANQGGSPWGIIGTTVDGTTTETAILVVGGESNDATAQYQPIPLGAAGRSVIIEGFTGGTAVPVSGSFSSGVVDESSFTLGTSSETPVGGVYLGGSNVPTLVNNQTGAVQLTADRKQVVSDPAIVVLLDYMQTLIFEVRAMRSAIVYMITENGDVFDNDFDPSNNNNNFQPLSQE